MFGLFGFGILCSRFYNCLFSFVEAEILFEKQFHPQQMIPDVMNETPISIDPR